MCNMDLENIHLLIHSNVHSREIRQQLFLTACLILLHMFQMGGNVANVKCRNNSMKSRYYNDKNNLISDTN